MSQEFDVGGQLVTVLCPPITFLLMFISNCSYRGVFLKKNHLCQNPITDYCGKYCADWCNDSFYRTLQAICRPGTEDCFCHTLESYTESVLEFTPTWPVSRPNLCICLCLIGFDSGSEGTIWVCWHKLLIQRGQSAGKRPVRQSCEGTIDSKYRLPVRNCWQLWLEGQGFYPLGINLCHPILCLLLII